MNFGGAEVFARPAQEGALLGSFDCRSRREDGLSRLNSEFPLLNSEPDETPMRPVRQESPRIGCTAGFTLALVMA